MDLQLILLFNPLKIQNNFITSFILIFNHFLNAFLKILMFSNVKNILISNHNFTLHTIKYLFTNFIPLIMIMEQFL